MSVPTGPVVSRTLAKRFKRSMRHSTRVRGWHDVTEGYRAQETSTSVVVTHQPRRHEGHAEPKCEEMVQKYAEFLRASGYVVHTTYAERSSYATVVERADCTAIKGDGTDCDKPASARRVGGNDPLCATHRNAAQARGEEIR